MNDSSAVIVVVVKCDVERIERQKSVSSDKIDSYNLENQHSGLSLVPPINSMVDQLKVKTDFAKCTSVERTTTVYK